MTKILLFALGCILTDNLVFGKLFSVTSADEANSVKGSAVLGLLTTIAATIAALICAIIPFFSGALQLLIQAAVILILVQILRALLKAKHASLEPLWLPAAIVAIMICIIAQSGTGAVSGVAAVFCTAIGYLIALVLMAGIRERLAYSKIPAAFKGLPISLITAGLMVLAFMGFTGLA